MVMKPTNYVNV